ncbi:MAG: hypothetical protein V4793_16230 [Paraburkholderia tropica]|nr:hypothetical protein [Paraburkholderia tropica]MBB3005240.1 hypothetical protein [Paraburkholderia tropica]MBB6324171.1 hypothetical protein [Paraburkholderia tropica]MDE1143941.1 hypothetical protein [Paraburkholderia tropica]
MWDQLARDTDLADQEEQRRMENATDSLRGQYPNDEAMPFQTGTAACLAQTQEIAS